MNWEDAVGHNFGGFNDKNNDKVTPLVEQATTHLMAKYHFITIRETDDILYYEDGVYVPGGDKLIAEEVEKKFHFKLRNNHLAEIKGHISRLTYVKHEKLDADINIINIKNGLYYVKENVLKPHTPEHLSINQKSITYDKDAKPKRFVDFLRQVLYPRDIRTGIEAMAYTFHRDYLIETIFMLHGFGANGKTVFTSLLTALHGPDNVSNVPLTEMLTNNFALSDLENKDLNIDSEVAGQTIKEAAVLKRLTGGSRQRIRIERKNQKAYDTILYAKLFFNANRIPDSQDVSDAYNRRLIIISFPNRFEGKNEDKHLISKLTTQEEISGIFNVLMNALRRVLDSGELYVNDKTIEDKRLKYKRTVHPIKSFLIEAISEESTENNYVTKENLYNAYVQFCKGYSLPTERYEKFCGILKNQSESQISEIRVEIEGKRVRVWGGIALVPKYRRKTVQTTIA